MKKIAVLCLSHFSGGMELDAIKYNRQFNQHGLDSILICRKGTFIESESNKNGESCFPIAFKRKLSLSLIRGLRQIIKTHSITDIVFFGASEIKSIYFAVYGLNCRVHVRHGTTKSSPKKDFIHQFLYRCTSYHIAISEHLRRNVLEIMPVVTEQVKTIYTPSPQLPCNRQELPQSSPKLIHVGRVAQGKGQHSALQALALTQNKAQLPISLYGGLSDTDYLNQLKQVVETHQLKASFCGHSDSVTDRLSEHNIFLFPSAGEGLPNSLIEALSMGLVCITFDNTVFPEFKQLGFHLHLVPDGDLKTLANTIDQVVNHLPQELDLCKKNRALCQQHFAAGPVVQQWIRLLDD